MNYNEMFKFEKIDRDGKLLNKLTDISVQKGKTELTAWRLLNPKNKHIGFSVDRYEL